MTVLQTNLMSFAVDVLSLGQKVLYLDTDSNNLIYAFNIYTGTRLMMAFVCVVEMYLRYTCHIVVLDATFPSLSGTFATFP